ncbi:MAG: glycosyltransferase [Bacteroidales bacterium]
MQKIIFLGPAHPYRGGIASFNEILARTFQKKNCKVKMFNFTLQYPSFLFPGKTQYTDSPAPSDLNICRCVNSINPFNWIKIGYKIYKEKPDVLLVRYWLSYLAPCLGTISFLARLNKHTKVLVLADNIIPHEKHFFDTFLTHYFVASTDGFIYMSEQVKLDLDQFTKTKPALFSPHPIYDNYGTGVDKHTACQALGLDPQFEYLLFFGFVRDYKGLDLFLEAFALLKAKQLTHNKKIIVAGEYYNDKNKYLIQIQHLGLEEDVILLDYFIPDTDVKFVFSAADIVVQPYKSATQSGVTQIAYNFNTPMLVTQVGGLAEIVPHDKVGYVTEIQPQAIADALENFYTFQRKDEFTNAIKKEKQRFSWDSLASQFEQLYEITK